MIKVEKHKSICRALHETYKSKNADYGDSFGETFDKFGMVSAVIRIIDKVNRLETLTTSERMVEDETIEDTLLDLANYAIMTVIEMDGKNEDNR